MITCGKEKKRYEEDIIRAITSLKAQSSKKLQMCRLQRSS